VNYPLIYQLREILSSSFASPACKLLVVSVMFVKNPIKRHGMLGTPHASTYEQILAGKICTSPENPTFPHHINIRVATTWCVVIRTLPLNVKSLVSLHKNSTAKS
jgi:hypothetical protein